MPDNILSYCVGLQCLQHIFFGIKNKTQQMYSSVRKETLSIEHVCKYTYTIKPLTILSFITVEREYLTVHLNHKYILVNDKLQYNFDFISSKHWDVTGYTIANI